jgi:hypothetical protein
MLLLVIAVAVLVGLVVREVIAIRRRGRGERIVDELTIEWVPADAIALTLEPDAEELRFGPPDWRPSRQRIPS